MLPIPILTSNINLPNGYHLNPYVTLTSSAEADKGIKIETEIREVRLENPELSI